MRPTGVCAGPKPAGLGGANNELCLTGMRTHPQVASASFRQVLRPGNLAPFHMASITTQTEFGRLLGSQLHQPAFCLSCYMLYVDKRKAVLLATEIT